MGEEGASAPLAGAPESATLTAAGKLMGTPHYMAPEQAEHPFVVDHRADIYSLGVVFYEMLTGELPLGRFPPPSRKVQVDVRLDEVVLRALEKEPERRYQRASQVKTKVETIARSERETAPAASVDARSNRLPTNKSTRLFAVIAAALLLLLAAWGNAVAMLVGSALMLVVGLFVFRAHFRLALLVALASMGVAAIIAMVRTKGMPFHRPPREVTVTGMVTDGTSGRPIAGARLAAEYERWGTGFPAESHLRECWTDPQGHFELSTWKGPCTLNASAPGYATRLTALGIESLGNQRGLRLDFQLPPANRVAAGSSAGTGAGVENRELLQVELRQAEAELARLKVLHDARAISDSEFQAAQDKMEVLKATLGGDPVRAAQIRLASAEGDLRRVSELFTNKLVSTSEFEAAQAEVQKRRLELEAAQAAQRARAVFGPVFERTLRINGNECDFLVLRTGEVLPHSFFVGDVYKSTPPTTFMQWVMTNKVDIGFCASTNSFYGPFGLQAFEMGTYEFAYNTVQNDTIPTFRSVAEWQAYNAQHKEPAKHVLISNLVGVTNIWNDLTADQLLGPPEAEPAFFLTEKHFSMWFRCTNLIPPIAFSTREGVEGLLQITGFTENPRGVTLRYKLVQQAACDP